MDVGLYARVLLRFWPLVLCGLVVAAGLAALSVVRVSQDGVTYRDPELWSSTTRLGVTQNGFPWGRLLAQEQTPDDAARNLGIPLADPNRLNTLAVLYAELATSDPVRRLMRRDGPVRGRILATPIVAGENRVMLPLIDLTAIAANPRAAVDLASRAADAFKTYLREQQLANNVPKTDRVVVEQLVRPKPPKIYQPRPKTMPIVVFLAVMFATIGLAFLLENVRPRKLGETAETQVSGPARRTA